MIPEFNHNGAKGERDWKLTPISDIIRAGATRNLICAFVTMTSPSMVQEAKMLVLTREIGFLLDDEMEVPPTEFRDDAMGTTIDNLFNDAMDGFLLQRYRMPMSDALPRRFRIFTDAIAKAGLGETFTLTELSRGLEASGIEETKGYLHIMKAIDDGILLSYMDSF